MSSACRNFGRALIFFHFQPHASFNDFQRRLGYNADLVNNIFAWALICKNITLLTKKTFQTAGYKLFIALD